VAKFWCIHFTDKTSHFTKIITLRVMSASPLVSLGDWTETNMYWPVMQVMAVLRRMT